MFRDEKLEVKVGLFIGVGIFVMFLIIFSIKDISLLGKGYEIDVIFNYVNGIKESSPVRLAGVNVGEVRKLELFYDDTSKNTKVRLDVRIRGGVKISDDSIARINTLGLLGEQYLEISPGISGDFLRDGSIVRGHDPVNVGQQMERMNELFSSMADIAGNISDGKGTLGKIMTDDALYNDLTAVFGKLAAGEGTMGRLLAEDGIYDDLSVITGRLREGRGTIGKLLVEEKIYDDMEGFVSDIKAHPWKLLHKTRERDNKSDDDDKKRGTSISPR